MSASSSHCANVCNFQFDFEEHYIYNPYLQSQYGISVNIELQLVEINNGIQRMKYASQYQKWYYDNEVYF